MKVAFFSIHNFEKEFFSSYKSHQGHDLTFFEAALNEMTAPLAAGFDCVCCFVSDHLDDRTLQSLKSSGVRLIALRSAGYNNVDLTAADRLGLSVVRVPAYSPHAVAEYAVGLLLALNRKIPKAYSRVRELNFSLEGMIGFDLFGKTIGVIGTGRIGSVFAKIMKGFGCNVLAFDQIPNTVLMEQKVLKYVSLEELYQKSDVISLHVPLSPETNHMINAKALTKMKRGLILLNTGRGALIDSVALIDSLKSGQLAGAGLDVYEEEEGIFYKDLSDQVLKDDVLARLLTFPNVLLTSHQAFLTREALENIAETTFKNISDFEAGFDSANQVRAKTHILTNSINRKERDNGKI